MFGFVLSDSDLVQTTVITSGNLGSGGGGGSGGAPTSAPFVTYGANADLSAERVLVAADGIVLDDSNAGQLQLKIERIKTIHRLTGSQAENIPFTIQGASFNSGSYNERRIDFYVNGQLMVSGTDNDYELVGNATDVRVKFPLVQNDTVVVVVQ